MEREQIRSRMMELMEPIDRQIMMCDDHKELIMFASCMLVTCKDLFDREIGPEGRKLMFKDWSK